MDSQTQLQRTHGHHQAEGPIRIQHPEEEEHHEKGPGKVLKKVKEKAKKIKKALTKHGHGHEHGEHIPDDHDLDEEDDEGDYKDQKLHGGAPARGNTHIKQDPLKEELVPPGTKFFPVVSSSHTKPIRGAEPVLRGSNASHGHEALSHPVRPSGVSEKEERRGVATLTPHNTPVSLLSSTEDVTRTFVPGEQRRVNIERPRGLEEDPAAPGGRSGALGRKSNHQSKVTDPTGKAGGEIGAAPAIPAFGRRQKTGEEDDQLRLGRDLPERSHGFDLKSGPKHLPAGNYGSGLEKESPARSHEFEVKSGAELEKEIPTGTQGLWIREDEMHQPNQSSYTDKIASVTSAVADKAAAAKNAVASKLGYYGELGDGGDLNRVKVEQTQQGQDKGVSAREYLSEKLSPGEEDKALSEVVAEKLHLGGENTTAPAKKGIVTQSEEVEKRLGGFSDPKSEGAMKHGEEAVAEEGEGGMVEMLRGAVTSWISGTTEEVMQKSTESVQDSSQSVGSTVGNMGFSGSGADGAGQRSGDKSDSVPVQKRFQESGN
ncbi:hypothetical protein EUTSA_v10024860mg [Eutrema salsugineum]|uniref:Low-temperature-induced 65 kDa protein n=1 Tax=Eutrema salsugineum TaxID=72664 RepID=V4P5H5_EUTSA|nr:low-temperature-induced 65 kDa protein [Eutrema salsugineum]ESQ54746.1 hypothetical protein EUTSA_v10024860mg [Eutrema salsugineum]